MQSRVNSIDFMWLFRYPFKKRMRKSTEMAEINYPELVAQLTETNRELTKQVALLTEQVQYLTNKIYARSSEKTNFQPGQTNLFDDEDLGQDDDGDSPYSRNRG